MKKNTDGNILVYVVILIIITMFLGMVVFNNSETLKNYKKIENVDSILAENIYYKGKLAIKYDKTVNLNGSGFIDDLSCPKININGNINSANNVSTTYVIENKNTIYCSGNYSGNKIKVKFNNDFTDFHGAEYLLEFVVLNKILSNYSAQFTDGDDTKVTFIKPSGDNIDDNFNSDNYKANSTGSIDYPNDTSGKNFGDDDVDARKINYGYVYKQSGLTNVFWNNSKTNKFIDKNINNDDNVNLKVGNIEHGILFFDIDKRFKIKIVEFDKYTFNSFQELRTNKTYNYTSISDNGEVGFLQKNSGVISLSSNSTAGDFIFDFKNKDYAIFIENIASPVNDIVPTIFYRIRGYDKDTGKGLYIVPIDDSDDIVIRYFGGNIIKSGSDYIYKFLDVVGEK